MRAFALMTALPPTKGHLHLIEFASAVALNTTVIVCTQPDEPYAQLRSDAIRRACVNMAGVTVRHLFRTLEQDPTVEGFWPMWQEIMFNYGFEPGDCIVSSEPYGQTLAALCGGTFVPYDPDRRLYYTKATRVREHPGKYFTDILPEFQPHLRQTVTFFGAESTGKTTISHQLSIDLNGHWLFEYARPYLELVGADLTADKMRVIWQGQRALQQHAKTWQDKPWIIQDTDLFSTIGYWEMYKDKFGPAPTQLIRQANSLKSDLYIITPSNIPFEQDQLRYGGAKRESTDKYWIDICEKYSLNYAVLSWPEGRTYEAAIIMQNFMSEKFAQLDYDRRGL